MKFKVLVEGVEDAFADDAANNAAVSTPQNKNAIVASLDAAVQYAEVYLDDLAAEMESAEEEGREFDPHDVYSTTVNPLIIGAGGSAKTSIIRNYFKNLSIDVPDYLVKKFNITSNKVSEQDAETVDKEVKTRVVDSIKNAVKQSNAEKKFWQKKSKINLYSQDVETMDVGDVKGYVVPNIEQGVANLMPSTLLDPMKENRLTVLYLDELNRGSMDVRYNVMKIIAEHTIPIALTQENKDGKQVTHGTTNLYLPYFLFTVASVNPDSDLVGELLSKPEKSRFKLTYVEADKQSTLEYYDKLFPRQLQHAHNPKAKKAIAGQIAIYRTLLNDDTFEFSDVGLMEGNSNYQHQGQRSNLMPRSLEAVLKGCDQGTVAQFLTDVKAICDDEEFEMIKLCLADVDEVTDKANEVIHGYIPKEAGVNPFEKAQKEAEQQDGLNLDAAA